MQKIIDIHQHFYKKIYTANDLVTSCKQNGIEKVCLFSTGENSNQPTNLEVKEACDQFPDTIIGFGYFRLGDDNVQLIDLFHEYGFKGIKFISPKKNYSDKEYYPIYKKMQEYKLIALFHTGFVGPEKTDHLFDVASERMRPVYLDTIARAFPKLIIIGAHVGVPWYNEACATVFKNPNVYYDLSGSVSILSERSDVFFETLTYWERAKNKFLYGTDTYYDDIQEVILLFNQLFDKRNFSDNLRDQIFYKNAKEILQL